MARIESDELPGEALWERTFPGQSEGVSSGRAESLFAGFEFLRSADPGELWELQSILIEGCKLYGSLACVVNAPLGWIARLGTNLPLELLVERWRRDGPCPLYFDFGKGQPPGGIDTKMIVTDPLWADGVIRGDYWRIHGWHSERWVRTYSQQELARLARLANLHHPQAVVLCHSMRISQWSELKKLHEHVNSQH